MTEREAAARLGVSHDTLLRERRRGRISYTIIGGRVRYTEAHLAEYVETRTVKCRAKDRTDPEPSPVTGSAGDPTPTNGAGPGSIATLDRLVAHHSASLILNGRN
jgi:excisionase family DNA binding protein